MRRVYKNLCPDMISASIMVSNMWKNSLKNAESDKNKIWYGTLHDFFFHSETLLNFWISLVRSWLTNYFYKVVFLTIVKLPFLKCTTRHKILWSHSKPPTCFGIIRPYSGRHSSADWFCTSCCSTWPHCFNIIFYLCAYSSEQFFPVLLLCA